MSPWEMGRLFQLRAQSTLSGFLPPSEVKREGQLWRLALKRGGKGAGTCDHPSGTAGKLEDSGVG